MCLVDSGVRCRPYGERSRNHLVRTDRILVLAPLLSFVGLGPVMHVANTARVALIATHFRELKVLDCWRYFAQSVDLLSHSAAAFADLVYFGP